MPRRRSTRELGLAHVAGLVPEVPVIECWVRWLRHQDHPLPLAEALQMNKLLPASTLARRDQLPILVASKAVAANDLLFLCCHPDFATQLCRQGVSIFLCHPKQLGAMHNATG